MPAAAARSSSRVGRPVVRRESVYGGGRSTILDLKNVVINDSEIEKVIINYICCILNHRHLI
jgi:hypothetical protein